MKRAAVLLSLACTALLAATSAFAADDQTESRTAGRAAGRAAARLHAHEESLVQDAGAVAGARKNFEVLDHVRLGGPTPDGDVYYFNHGKGVGKYAYVGTWGSPCTGRGVKIVRVTRPRRAKLVAVAGTREGVSNEDVVVKRIGGRTVLGVGVQDCSGSGRAGLALFDVTNPREPKRLSFLPVPAGGVHELDMVVREDGRALALLAVPFVEFLNTYLDEDLGGEFRIVDITDPRNPVEVADWGIIADSSLPLFGGVGEVTESFQGLGYFATHYDHSARAADKGETAYLSYWDGGVLKFDISDPSAPQLIGRTIYDLDVDGDAHSLAIRDVGGERYIFQNDEDFEALSPVVVTSTETGAKRFAGIDEPWAPTQLLETGEVTGEVFDADDGCQAPDFQGAAGRVALADVTDPSYFFLIPGWTVPCDIGRIVLNAAQADAEALLLNLISPADAAPFAPSGNTLQQIQTDARGMPIVQVSDIDGLADAIRGAPGNAAASVTLTPQEPSWGFIRVFRESETDTDSDGVFDFEQVGEFSALAHVTGEYPAPNGSWSVHNTEVAGERAYSSWYAHGVVALDVSDPANPVRLGRFARPSRARSGVFGDDPFPQVWGVAIDRKRGLIYASDMRSGLWILRPTGPAAAP